jgi:hypothetical protein
MTWIKKMVPKKIDTGFICIVTYDHLVTTKFFVIYSKFKIKELDGERRIVL